MKQFKIEVPEGYEIDRDKSTFENIVFKKKEKNRYPSSWEEVSAIEGIFHNEKQAESVFLLNQLLQLRDYYRNGWVPDYTDDYVKYTIEYYENEVITCNYYNSFKMFCFQSKEVRNVFFNNFKEDIKTYYEGLI